MRPRSPDRRFARTGAHLYLTRRSARTAELSFVPAFPTGTDPMSVDLPTWTAFDPEAPATLPVLPPPSGRVVALLASPAATAAEWGPAIAAGLARGWSREGSRVVLADLGLARPTLHTAFGEPDGEGVTDVVAFGASPKRVARPVDGEAFFVVPAGTVVADVPATLASPRWAVVCEGFRDAGVVLALYLPTKDPARASALAVATDAVILADEGEDVSSLLTDVDLPIRGVLGPSAAQAVVSPEPGALDRDGTSSPSESDRWSAPAEVVGESRDESVSEAPEHAEAAGPLPEVAQPSALAGPPSETVDQAGSVEHGSATGKRESLRPNRGTTRRQPVRSSKRTSVLLVVLVLVILGVLAAAWLGFIHIPGITPSRDAAAHAVGAFPVAIIPSPDASTLGRRPRVG